MGLPEQTKYKSYASAIMPTIRAAQKMYSQQPIQRQPSRKAIDTSKYQGLTNAIREGTRVGPIGTVTVPYGGSTRYEKFHPGIDIANKIGTPIRSLTPGTVTQVVGGQKQGDKGYGNYAIVTDAQGNKHRYSHLNQGYVQVGQQVQRGTQLGQMGNTGSTYSLSGGTGSHLDYRVRDMYNKYINPLRFVY